MLSARVERQLGTMIITNLAVNSVHKSHTTNSSPAWFVYPVMIS